MPTTYVDPISSAIQLPISSLLIDETQITDSVAAVQEVLIKEGEGQHDSVSILLKFASTKLDDYINKPVSFTYGPSARFNRFFGYVVSVTPSRTYKEDLTVTFDCLGVTWVMRYGQPRFLRNKTTSQIINEVVLPYQLGTMIDEFTLRDKPYQWFASAQTDETDFEFVVDMAHRIGFCCFINDGVLRIVDPIKLLKQTGSIVTLVKGDDVNDNSRSLLDFTPQTQSLKTHDSQDPKYGFFVSSGGSTRAIVSPVNSNNRIDTDQAITDQLMADACLQAWSNRPELWSQQATARIMGDASIQPGAVVSTHQSGSSVIRNDYDGAWVVMTATHSLTQTSFQSTLGMSRTPMARLGSLAYQPWFHLSQRPRPFLLKKTLADRTVQWTSSWAGLPNSEIGTAQTSTGFAWKGAA